MSTDKPTRSDWQEAASKEVKGKDIVWHTPEGIEARPLIRARVRGPRRAEDRGARHAHLLRFARDMGGVLTEIMESPKPAA